jgi:ATP-dependent RNA helicase SUPV3L1/SUV3
LEQKGIDEIAHLAQSGRTSIPVDHDIAPGLYRAAGFRVCGGRAVRVDILERLADLIRPAITYRPGVTPGEPPPGTADGEGFVPTVSMTSLVGCAGEDFATILKSLGYVAENRAGPAITVPLASAPRVVEAPAPAGEDVSADAAGNEPSPETPTDAAAEAPVLTEEVGAVAAEAPDGTASVEEAVESAQGTSQGAPASIESGGEEAVAVEAAAEPETIEVWRQHRRHHEGGHVRHGRGRPDRGERPERGDRRPRHAEAQGQHPSGERSPRQGPRPDRRPDRPEGQGEGGRPQNRPPRGPGRPDERRGPRPEKRAEGRRDSGPDRREREKQPDPNSPFAKLMALKVQLEDSKK